MFHGEYEYFMKYIFFVKNYQAQLPFENINDFVLTHLKCTAYCSQREYLISERTEQLWLRGILIECRQVFAECGPVPPVCSRC